MAEIVMREIGFVFILAKAKVKIIAGNGVFICNKANVCTV